MSELQGAKVESEEAQPEESSTEWNRETRAIGPVLAGSIAVFLLFGLPERPGKAVSFVGVMVLLLVVLGVRLYKRRASGPGA